MKSINHILKALLLLFIVSSCATHPEIPKNAQHVDAQAPIYPDYCDVTVPLNIAPLNFMLPDSLYSECVAVFTLPNGEKVTYGCDNKVIIPEDEWAGMLKATAGKDLDVVVYGKREGKESWESFKGFKINVAKDPIDPYISYRLIEPGYVMYNQMSINQRALSSFDENQIINNKVAADGTAGQCINCHSYQNYNTDNMLFHVRFNNGKTVIVNDGKPYGVDLKREGMISAGVYPAWHPKAKLIAFSTNKTAQLFRTSDPDKVEVFDSASDLMLYDVTKDEVTIISNDTTRLEVFPTWSPDGKWLYYCSTLSSDDSNINISEDDSISVINEMGQVVHATAPVGGNFEKKYKKVKYNIYRRSFDANSKQFGEEELVYDAVTKERSSSLPRISPDGKSLVFAEGDFGCFNIWHNAADILIMDLGSRSLVDSHMMNSNKAESYPSFSSNGKWIMCASRRDDGNYSRVYISYYDGKHATKAFMLPQKDPEDNTMLLKSFNRPEFMVKPVNVSITEFVDVIKAPLK